ncbi:hypothetical protein NHI66_003169 [Clostridium botulinum]|nr:hypothetical protein [Clostridium botulinum]
MTREPNVVKVFNKEADNLYHALLNITNPSDIGTVIMYYIVNNYEGEKERLEIIRLILNRLFTDFFINELPEGELARIRKVVNMI